MRFPEWAAMWMVYLILLTSFVMATFVSQRTIQDAKDASVDDSDEDYSNIDPYQRRLMELYGGYRLGRYRGFGGYTNGNSTSGDLSSAMLKWFLGISGSAILFLLCLVLFLCRKDLGRCFHRIYRHLYKRWADRYAADRKAIMKDVDDELFSSSDVNGKLVVDKIVYRAVSTKRQDSEDFAKADYTAVPLAPDSPVKDPPSKALSNGPQLDPVKSKEKTDENTDKTTEEDISSQERKCD